ncbi:MAG: ABC transporter substrate-binding protein [Deltaproteobacteria bacterium]|nr:ABC transporter substrate-binding protein [Deltaproteobacteria bacterium]
MIFLDRIWKRMGLRPITKCPACEWGDDGSKLPVPVCRAAAGRRASLQTNGCESVLRGLVLFLVLLYGSYAYAQEKIKLSYSSVDGSNAVWFVAKERGFYQKHGLDADMVFILSTTTSVASLVAGDVKAGNASAGAVASATLAGASLVITGCFINILPYELVVHESIRSPEDLREKSVGISRVGASSDVAARVLIKGLGLEPVKEVAILQVGGPAERAAAFRTGRIVGFPSPPGVIKLAKGMPHRVLISTADLKKRFDFPYTCSVMTKSFFGTQKDTVRRLLMALIEAAHFFKTRKEESKKILAKYSKQYDEAYLEASYVEYARIHDRVPLVTREGTEAQIREALSRKPGASLKVEDIVDDSVVVELEKGGFIDRIYR